MSFFSKKVENGLHLRRCLWATALMFVPSLLFSQGLPAPNQTRQNQAYQYPSQPNAQNSNGWQSSSRPTEYVPPQAANVDPEKWWPDEPVRYDSSVQPSTHLANIPSTGATSDGGDFVSGSTSSANELTDDTSGRLSGLMGAVTPSGDFGEQLKKKFAGADIQKMLGSLAVVLGGYFGFVWLWRRFNLGNQGGGLPSEVLEVVGQTPFGPRKTLQLVRLGTKLLLIVNSPEGTHPIGEVSDPNEVERISKLCGGEVYDGPVEREHALQNLVGQVQSGMYAPQPTPFVTPYFQPQVVAAPMMHAPVAQPASSTGELEKILKTLTQVVQQSSHQNSSRPNNHSNEFEA